MTSRKIIDIAKVDAKDLSGNVFPKEVSLEEGYGGLVVSFESPCEYCLNDLLKHYPYDKPLCIDMTGGNHRGSDVNISAEDMNRVLEIVTVKKDLLR
jgi:hypothetical protein